MSYGSVVGRFRGMVGWLRGVVGRLRGVVGRLRGLVGWLSRVVGCDWCMISWSRSLVRGCLMVYKRLVLGLSLERSGVLVVGPGAMAHAGEGASGAVAGVEEGLAPCQGEGAGKQERLGRERIRS